MSASDPTALCARIRVAKETPCDALLRPGVLMLRDGQAAIRCYEAPLGGSKLWQLAPGELLLIASGQPLRFHFEALTPWAVFESWPSNGLPALTSEVSFFTASQLQRDPTAQALWRLLGNEQQRAVQQHLLHALCAVLLERRQPPSQLSPGDATGDPVVDRAIALMKGDLARRWTLSEVCSAVGSSRAALVRRFRRALAEPPLRHLTRCRMARAAELLVTTRWPLAVIAAEVGYESEFALSRAFRRFHGVAPGAYRQGQSLRPLALAA